jgi:S-DNA-T family DNA segregation ATPase FtsK/SpoIIIE
MPGGAPNRTSPVPTIGVLPSAVAFVAPTRAAGDRPWRLPVGIADADLGLALLSVHDGEHVLVAGPAGSGRTSALRMLATLTRAIAPSARLYGVAGRPSRLLTDPVLDAVGSEALAVVEAIVERSARADECGPVVIFVDDADWLDEPNLAALLSRPRQSVHVIAAARPDGLRGLHGHWLGVVRRSRLGLLLQPALDVDGDLLGVALPRRQIVPAMPGRGYLVADGRAALVHLALPPDAANAPGARHALHAWGARNAADEAGAPVGARPPHRATAAAIP